MAAKSKAPEDDGYDYIRRYYGVPVMIGQAVECDGHKGTVVKATENTYLRVKIDGRLGNWHPTWETVYYHPDGTIAADYGEKKAGVV